MSGSWKQSRACRSHRQDPQQSVNSLGNPFPRSTAAATCITRTANRGWLGPAHWLLEAVPCGWLACRFECGRRPVLLLFCPAARKRDLQG